MTARWAAQERAHASPSSETPGANQCLALSAGPLSPREQPWFPDPQVLWSQGVFSSAPAASYGAPAPARGTCPEGVSQPQSGSELFWVGQHADWGLLHGGQRRGAPGPRVPVTFSISRKHLPPCSESGGTEAPRKVLEQQECPDPAGPHGEAAPWSREGHTALCQGHQTQPASQSRSNPTRSNDTTSLRRFPAASRLDPDMLVLHRPALEVTPQPRGAERSTRHTHAQGLIPSWVRATSQGLDVSLSHLPGGDAPS